MFWLDNNIYFNYVSFWEYDLILYLIWISINYFWDYTIEQFDSWKINIL